uniref:(northern house mosquito) hypothetical protein n=1 Tax=Culex pipiens TaxID=7175 RepID=A0A8D8B9P0_CULPI
MGVSKPAPPGRLFPISTVSHLLQRWCPLGGQHLQHIRFSRFPVLPVSIDKSSFFSLLRITTVPLASASAFILLDLARIMAKYGVRPLFADGPLRPLRRNHITSAQVDAGAQIRRSRF